MQLFNTLGRHKEPFIPRGGPVRLYVCGITPYATTHLGHARTYVLFDVLLRYLRYLGREVRYIQNITDVDDPLFRRAAELGVHYQELAAKNVATYKSNMAALGVLPADVYPRASEEIAAIQNLIAGLLERGYAYSRDVTVLFRVAADPEYGKLSRLRSREMAASNAEQDSTAPPVSKENPLDFVLWRPSAPSEDSWPSPWGPGRPGWHIECSAMALRYLGEGIDIHGGGADLIFPHHENEIAQSESYTGVRPFARYWLHVGLVRLNGVKMSKSLGNLIMVDDLLESHSPQALRLYLLGYPYREPFDYDSGRLTATRRATETLAQASSVPSPLSSTPLDPDPFLAHFLSAMDDDLDTPAAIAAMVALAMAINHSAAKGEPVEAAQRVLREMLSILGIAAPFPARS